MRISIAVEFNGYLFKVSLNVTNEFLWCWRSATSANDEWKQKNHRDSNAFYERPNHLGQQNDFIES